jgi:hypothetical protein
MFKLTDEQYIKLVNKWIINWCGSSKWFSFSSFARKLSELDYFDNDKYKTLVNDIERYACWPHDTIYAMWWWKIDKLIWDIQFCNYIFSKIKWANLALRVFLYITILIWLIKEWKKTFNYWVKLYLDDLLE